MKKTYKDRTQYEFDYEQHVVARSLFKVKVRALYYMVYYDFRLFNLFNLIMMAESQGA